MKTETVETEKRHILSNLCENQMIILRNTFQSLIKITHLFEDVKICVGSTITSFSVTDTEL